jgi:hypothetical protein
VLELETVGNDSCSIPEEEDFIYYNIIAIKWGESTHFPGRNDPGEQVIRVKRPGFIAILSLTVEFTATIH